MASESDTIAALASAPGKSAIAVIRISGPRTRFVVETITGSALPPARTATLRKLRSPSPAGDLIDEALVTWFPGPASYTGEDSAEIGVHGGRNVVRAALEALTGIGGVRIAEPGEFTRRAFSHGKLDMTEVEAVADLIDSETDQQRRQALRQLEGRFSGKVEMWRRALLDARAFAEASIDFVDEADVAADAMARAVGIAERVREEMDDEILRRKVGQRVRDGFRIVLAGPPNAGKSSLLNALVRRSVAITSPVPGTTRDAIEVAVDIGGYAVTFVDTAGVRETVDELERLGIERTHAAVAEADLVLWLSPVTAPAEVGVRASGTIVVCSQSDRAELSTMRQLAVSIHDPDSVDRLVAMVLEKVSGGAAGEAGVITRVRHETEIRRAIGHLGGIAEQVGDDHPELVAESLRLSLDCLGRLVGTVDVEDVLGQIFSTFCIGK